MKKIAFVDIDGIIADNTRRVLDCTTGYDKNGKAQLDWDEFFKAERVEQDTLIAAAPERLEILAGKGYEIILLTGRPAFAPHCLESVTASWLARHGVTTPHTLLCKPEEAKYMKTAAWKASIIYALARFMKATDLVIVDDDPRNAAAHVRNDHYAVWHFESLADAIVVGEQ
jgi:hypothetical protein